MNTIFVHLTFKIKVSTYFQTPMAVWGTYHERTYRNRFERQLISKQMIYYYSCFDNKNNKSCKLFYIAHTFF